MKTFLKSFVYAFQGIEFCIKHQQNFRFHSIAMLIAIVAGFWLHISQTEWWVVLLCCALVLTSEMINTAIEKLCDVVNPSHHPQIKIVKDVAAGAVLVVAIVAAICGAIIFIPKLCQIL